MNQPRDHQTHPLRNNLIVYTACYCLARNLAFSAFHYALMVLWNCLERLVLQLAYASGDQSRLDILMRFFTVMYRTYLV